MGESHIHRLIKKIFLRAISYQFIIPFFLLIGSTIIVSIFSILQILWITEDMFTTTIDNIENSLWVNLQDTEISYSFKWNIWVTFFAILICIIVWIFDCIIYLLRRITWFSYTFDKSVIGKYLIWLSVIFLSVQIPYLTQISLWENIWIAWIFWIVFSLCIAWLITFYSYKISIYLRDLSKK